VKSNCFSSRRFLASAIILLTVCLSGSAAVVDGSFESPDFGGWSFSQTPSYLVIHNDPPDGPPTVTLLPINLGRWGIATGPTFQPDAHSFGAINLSPVDGQHYGFLYYAHSPAVLPPANGVAVTMSQQVQLGRGQILSGSISAFTDEYIANHDSAFVRIVDQYGSTIATPYLAFSDTDIPYQTSMQWTHWNWEVPTDGTYTIELGVTGGDAQYATTLFFDGLNVSAVPEPSTLLAGGLLTIPFGLQIIRLVRKRMQNLA
jgi:hypothetical protein